MVLVLRDRLQLRLPCHVESDRRSTPVQLSGTSRVGAEIRTASLGSSRGKTIGPASSTTSRTTFFTRYSTYARGCESLTDAYRLLDRTPYGRQEDFEESPAGWPQRPTYGRERSSGQRGWNCIHHPPIRKDWCCRACPLLVQASCWSLAGRVWHLALRFEAPCKAFTVAAWGCSMTATAV